MNFPRLQHPLRGEEIIPITCMEQLRRSQAGELISFMNHPTSSLTLTHPWFPHAPNTRYLLSTGWGIKTIDSALEEITM